MLALLGQLDPTEARQMTRRRYEPAPRQPSFGKPAGAAQQPGQFHRGESHVRIAAVDALAGDLQARHRLLETAFVAVEAGEPHQVPGRSPTPDFAVSVTTFYMSQQAAERHHVLGVVAGDDPDR